MKPGPASPPDRYAPHRLIDGFDQDRLARTDVIVVGAGAVGNEALKNLALLGVEAAQRNSSESVKPMIFFTCR